MTCDSAKWLNSSAFCTKSCGSPPPAFEVPPFSCGPLVHWAASTPRRHLVAQIKRPMCFPGAEMARTRCLWNPAERIESTGALEPSPAEAPGEATTGPLGSPLTASEGHGVREEPQPPRQRQSGREPTGFLIRSPPVAMCNMATAC